MPELRCTNLLRMAKRTEGLCLRVLGACFQTGGAHEAGFAEVVRTGWAACHVWQALWRAPGHLTQKLRLLQMMIFASMSWPSGTRRWTASEFRGLKTVQTEMTRRWATEDWAIANIPHRDVAVDTVWWRWAGRAGHLCQVDPWCWVSKVTQ